MNLAIPSASPAPHEVITLGVTLSSIPTIFTVQQNLSHNERFNTCNSGRFVNWRDGVGGCQVVNSE